jgi:hypothetical protein
MREEHFKELPIRSKLEMVQDLGKIIHYLHTGQRSAADLLIEDMKVRSIFMDDQIQQDVLSFAEQVHFQYDYDPLHQVTKEIQRAADKLLEDLGFSPPGEN